MYWIIENIFFKYQNINCLKTDIQNLGYKWKKSKPQSIVLPRYK